MMAWVFAVALLGLIGFATYFILEQQKNAERRSRLRLSVQKKIMLMRK